jgi:predicted Zn finger-like uncharacterized protein
MKFFCENCSTKYQIADEKVAGRSVRMKCRKCGNPVEIRSAAADTSATLVFSANLLRAGSEAPAGGGFAGTRVLSDNPLRAALAAAEAANPAASARAPQPGPRETKQSRRALGPAPTGTIVHGGLAAAFQQAVAEKASEPAPSAGGEWFVGIGGSSVGPIGLDELRSRASAGEVQEGALVWREGFNEWLPIETVPELRDIARLIQPARAPLSARAGTLVGRLGFGPRLGSKPSTGGGQVVPLVPRGEGPKIGEVPGGDVNATLALSPGAMPLMLPGILGRSGAATNTPPATRGGPGTQGGPNTQGGPATRGGPGTQGGPNTQGGPTTRGGPGAQGGPATRGGPAGPISSGPAPSGGPLSPSPGGPFGGPGMGAPGMGAPGMGALGMGSYGQPPAPVLQQVAPFPQQPFGAPGPAPMALPSVGLPPPAGFPGGPQPAFVMAPPRRKGIPFVGWFAVAVALGTGVVVGARWFASDKTEVQVGGGAQAGGASVATADDNTNPAGVTAVKGESTGTAKVDKVDSGGTAAAKVDNDAAAAKAESTGAGGAGDAAAADAGSKAIAGKPDKRQKNGQKTAAVTKPTPTAKAESKADSKSAEIVVTGSRPPAPPPPPPPPPAPAAEEKGRLSDVQVQGVVANGRAAIRRACWEPALAASGGGSASVRITVALTIGPDGKVKQATASGGETFPSLGGCVSSRVRSWIFPSSSEITQTMVSFKFLSQ